MARLVTGGRQKVCWEAGRLGVTVHRNSLLMVLVFSVKSLTEGNQEGEGSGNLELEKVRSRSE